MVGQNVAAMPDQPKMTNQKMVRSGESTDTAMAIARAISAITSVTFLERAVSLLPSIFG